ncbi:MAG TPA: hypothetical protein VG406_17870 [Isosphaeraceae bacterium]|jgi:hypothetical protein|nr:hypothetical protein [Isosphaeraceae bacterium]
MRPTAPLSLALFAALALAPLVPAADGPKPSEANDKLVGSWKLTTAKYRGQEFPFPETFTTMKIVTAGRYVLVIYGKDGSVARASGGSYRLVGDTYEETPEFSTTEGFEALKSKPQSFHCKVEGDKWIHDGTLTSGMTVEEVWERADKK